MTQNPYVELLHSDLQRSALVQAESRFIGTPREQIEAALSTYRLLAINHVKTELRKTSTVSGAELLRLADLASMMYLSKFTAMVGPSATEAYIRAFRGTQAGNVPSDLIYALANQHAERMGKYFHETSREALVQGFNRMVNQGVAEKVAADRAMDAFGLTVRQMSGFVALVPGAKVASSRPPAVKAKMLDYINRSVRRRVKTFANQEEHNLEQQAQQVVWMWQAEKGHLSSHAQKVWITAKDEKVCKICGPMHGKRAGVSERFTMPDGTDLYVPGAHVNCRCEVKLVDPISLVQKADFEDLHPRDEDGQFKNKYSVAARTKEAPDTTAFQTFLDQAEQLVEPEKAVPTTFSLTPVKDQRPAQQFSMTKGSLSAVNKPETFSMTSPTFSMSPKTFSMLDVDQQQFSIGAQAVASALLRENEHKIGLEHTPKRDKFYRETYRFKDGPVYSFVSSDQIDERGMVLLTGDERFTHNRSQIESGAGQLHMDLVERAVGRASEDGLDYIERTDDGGNMQHAYVDREDLYNIAGALSSSSPANTEKLKVQVIWYDHMGDEVEHEAVSYETVAYELGWGPEDFLVYIMRVDEGHNGKRGTTEPKDDGSYRLTGNFTTVHGGGAPAGPVGEIHVLNGDPDTPTEQFKADSDD